MTKKIIDIYPPRSKPSSFIPHSTGQNSRSSAPAKDVKKRKTPSIFLGFIVILIIFGIGVIFLTTQSRLTLKIQPVTEPFRFEESFEAQVSGKEIDFEKRIIPGRFFEKEIQSEEQFASTGILEKTGKAEGKIKVYNTNTPPTPVTLKAQTRFLSSEGGKIFKATTKIYIPSARVEGGKVIPGVVEINVVAQEAGENHNIGPSKFSVPGLVGNPLYYTIYAESESSMIGGFKEEVKVINEKDIENAKNSLSQKIFEKAKDSLRKEASQVFVLLDDSITKILEEISCPQELGTETDSFSCEGSVKIKGLGFKKSDIEELSEFSAASLLLFSQVLIERTLNLQYLRPEVIIEKGKLFADLDVEIKTYKDIPVDVLVGEIKGKSKKEIESFIYDNYPQVQNLEMKFWPFWVNKAPKNSEKIDIEMIVQ